MQAWTHREASTQGEKAIPNLVSLKSMEKDIDVKSRDVMACIDICIQFLELGKQEGQQSSLTALCGDHGPPIPFAHHRFVDLPGTLLKP